MSVTEAHTLFNPAFISLLLRRFADGYCTEAGFGAPIPLTFLAVPIVLHEETRASLPKTTATKMQAWTQVNSQYRVGLGRRCRVLSTFIRDGILFGIAAGTIKLAQNGALYPTIKAVREPSESNEVTDCLRKAAFVGKWFALAGDQNSIFATWGVRP